MNGLDHPSFQARSGYAFELLGLTHIGDVKMALRVDAIQPNTSGGIGNDNGDKAQIDFVIDRRDYLINICSFKFSMKPFVIDQKYAET